MFLTTVLECQSTFKCWHALFSYFCKEHCFCVHHCNNKCCLSLVFQQLHCVFTHLQILYMQSHGTQTVLWTAIFSERDIYGITLRISLLIYFSSCRPAASLRAAVSLPWRDCCFCLFSVSHSCWWMPISLGLFLLRMQIMAVFCQLKCIICHSCWFFSLAYVFRQWPFEHWFRLFWCHFYSLGVLLSTSKQVASDVRLEMHLSLSAHWISHSLWWGIHFKPMFMTMEWFQLTSKQLASDWQDAFLLECIPSLSYIEYLTHMMRYSFSDQCSWQRNELSSII